MKSALIVKTSSIGDILHTFDTLSYLKEKHKVDRIDWVVEKPFARLVSSHPYVSNAIIVDTKLWRRNPLSGDSLKQIRDVRNLLRTVSYDAVFDLQGNSKSALFTLWSNSRFKVGYSWNCVPEKTNWFVTYKKISVPLEDNVRKRYLSLVQGFFGDLQEFVPTPTSLKVEPVFTLPMKKDGVAIAVCFSSNWSNKRVDEDALVYLCHRLLEIHSCSFYFIWGNEVEKKIAERLADKIPSGAQAVGGLGLPELQMFLSSVDGVIAMDSAPLHLAALTSTPTFSFFGPSKLSVYKPLGDSHHGVQGNCPYGVTFTYRCPKLRSCDTGACIRPANLNRFADPLVEWFKHVVLEKAPLIRN